MATEYVAMVTAASGSTVKLRASASAAERLYGEVPVGTRIKVLEQQAPAGWRYCDYSGGICKANTWSALRICRTAPRCSPMIAWPTLAQSAGQCLPNTGRKSASACSFSLKSNDEGIKMENIWAWG